MLSLDQLAPELIAHIACFLDKPTLLSLCTVCQRLSPHAEDALYKIVTIQEEMIDYIEHTHPLKALLITVIRRPKLGRKVRVVIHREKRVFEREKAGVWSAEEYEMLCDAAERVGLISSTSKAMKFLEERPTDPYPTSMPVFDEDTFMQLVLYNDIEALLMLFLSQLPNIQTLVLHAPDRLHMPWNVAVSSPCSHGFRHLTSFYIVGWLDWSIQKLSPLISLPSLRTFGASSPHRGQWFFRDSHKWPCPKGSLAIKNIHLGLGQYSTEGFAKAIESCASLESFTFRWYAYGHTSWDRLAPTCQALLIHKETLKHLSLDLDHDVDTESMQDRGSFSICDFSNLASLEIHQTYLRRDNVSDLRDVLPQSLQELYIVGDWKFIGEIYPSFLTTYTGAFKAALPCLREFHMLYRACLNIKLSHEAMKPSTTFRKELRALCPKGDVGAWFAERGVRYIERRMRYKRRIYSLYDGCLIE